MPPYRSCQYLRGCLRLVLVAVWMTCARQRPNSSSIWRSCWASSCCSDFSLASASVRRQELTASTTSSVMNVYGNLKEKKYAWKKHTTSNTNTCIHTDVYTITIQTRSFSVVGPTTWNGLPIDLRHLPNDACSQFHHLLKTVLFRFAWVRSTSE